MKITSLAFGDNLPVPVQYTCNGADASPPLEFIDVPEDAASLALIVEDMDAPETHIHWVVYNIPGDVTHFDEGEIPDGAVNGLITSGEKGYLGPCPKDFDGPHRFSFTLFALDTVLDIPSGAGFSEIMQAMQGHMLSRAVLIGLAEGERTQKKK
jgi:Raf kinase inhibitor-like YbhB/YbcL family protein